MGFKKYPLYPLCIVYFLKVWTPCHGGMDVDLREETICEEYADALPSSEYLLAVEGIFFCMPPEAQLRSKSRLAGVVGFSSLVVGDARWPPHYSAWELSPT